MALKALKVPARWCCARLRPSGCPATLRPGWRSVRAPCIGLAASRPPRPSSDGTGRPKGGAGVTGRGRGGPTSIAAFGWFRPCSLGLPRPHTASRPFDHPAPPLQRPGRPYLESASTPQIVGRISSCPRGQPGRPGPDPDLEEGCLDAFLSGGGAGVYLSNVPWWGSARFTNTPPSVVPPEIAAPAGPPIRSLFARPAYL